MSGTVEAKKKKYPNGDYYTGEWEKGQPNGFGKMVYANGNIYEGLWNEGKFIEGKFTDPKNNVFEGTFENGGIIKNGKMTYSNGYWCEGDWKNNKLFNGQCKSIISDSLYFEGEVKNGLPLTGIGKGRITQNYYDGKWINGEFIGHCILNKCADRILKFEGERKNNGCYNGKLEFKDGSYVGEIGSNFSKHGKGELNLKKYSFSIKGIWENNILFNGSGKLFRNNRKVIFDIENMFDKKIAKITINGLQKIENTLHPIINEKKLAESIVDMFILKERKEKKAILEKYFSGKVFYTKKTFDEYYPYMAYFPLVGSAMRDMFDDNMIFITFIVPIDENRLLFAHKAKIENQPESYNRGYLLQQSMFLKEFTDVSIYNYTIENGYLIFKSENEILKDKKYQIINHSLYDSSMKIKLSSCSYEDLNKFLISNNISNIDTILKNANNYSLPEDSLLTSTELKAKYAKYATSLPDREPEIQGGISNLKKLIYQNLRYPTIAIENGIQGIAIVKICVTRDGKTGDIGIAESSGDAYLDGEAVRVIKLLNPKCIPGITDGLFVDAEIKIPCVFRLR